MTPVISDETISGTTSIWSSRRKIWPPNSMRTASDGTASAIPIATTIAMTMYNVSTNLSQQVVQEVVKHFGDRVFETLIPRNVRLAEAPSYGKPVIDYDRQCAGSQAYLALACEVLRKETGGEAIAETPA